MQETTELTTKIEAIVRPHLKFLESEEALAPDMNLSQAGLDSMASINLILDLEDDLGISIPDDLLTENSFTSLANIRELIEGLPVAA
ncbi:MAG: acyl carrier protein [Verrucomicrobiales bacterium]|jgi:acyl carrier protein